MSARWQAVANWLATAYFVGKEPRGWSARDALHDSPLGPS